MQVHIKQPDLMRAVKAAASAVSSKANIPILSHIYLSIDTEKKELCAVGTDLEVWIEQRAPVVGIEDGADHVFPITAPARTIEALVSSIPAGAMVTLTPDDKGVTVKAGEIKTRLLCLEAEYFAQAPNTKDAALCATATTEEWARSYRFISHAIMTLDGDFAVLKGACLTIGKDGAPTVTATNKHKLAHTPLRVTAATGEGAVIIPDRALKLLTAAAAEDPKGGESEEIHVALTPEAARFTWKCSMLQTRLVDGAYPDWRRFVQREYDRTATVIRKDLMNAISRALLTSDPHSVKRIVLDIEQGRVNISSQSGSVGSTSENVDAALEGEPIRLAVDGHLILDALRSLPSDAALLSFCDPMRGFTIKPVPDDGTGFQFVMPLSLID